MFGDHMMKLNVKNVLNFINNDSHIDKQGYLLKKGEEPAQLLVVYRLNYLPFEFVFMQSQVNKGWQRRWFLLKGNMLFYYHTPQDSEPIGLIVLEGCSINCCLTDTTTFSITFQCEAARTYHLCADDEETCASWVNSLQRSSYGYLKAQVDRMLEQVLALELKKESSLENPLVAPDGTSSRTASLTDMPVRSHKVKSGIRALTSPLTLRRKMPNLAGECKRSPGKHRKNKEQAQSTSFCRAFEEMHIDFAPGQPVISDTHQAVRTYTSTENSLSVPQLN